MFAMSIFLPPPSSPPPWLWPLTIYQVGSILFPKLEYELVGWTHVTQSKLLKQGFYWVNLVKGYALNFWRDPCKNEPHFHSMNLQSSLGHDNTKFEDSRRALFIIIPKIKPALFPSRSVCDNSAKANCREMRNKLGDSKQAQGRSGSPGGLMRFCFVKGGRWPGCI